MHTNASRDLQTPERSEGGYEKLTNYCPICGEVIDGFDADGRTTIQPCGHAAGEITTQTMTSTTDSDAHRVMTDGGEQRTDERVRVVFQTYADDADLETDQYGQITNHDELVNAGQVYREIRFMSTGAIAEFDMETVGEDHSLWCEEVAAMEPGDVVRVDELERDDDAE